MHTIANRIEILRDKIAKSCAQYGRPANSVKTIAVAKTFPADAVRAALSANITDIGENYLQESIGKIAELKSENATWHFIGKIQSNKSRLVATHFDWVHTIHSLSLARRLSDAREGMPPLNICLQINIDNESDKNGIAADDALALSSQIATLPNLRLRGLMALPRPDHQNMRTPFAAMADLYRTINDSGIAMDTLSMGMSADFDSAIAEGATHIRIGSAIFGERS